MGATDAGALGERLASMARQQEAIGQRLTELQSVMGNKQARGAFGEVQLERLVADLLPRSAYRFQAPLGRNRVDCLIALPWPPGPVPVDAKFPLENYQRWLATGDAKALRLFKADVTAHVQAISNKYLVPGQTADFGLMFLPSEAVFAALHEEARDIVEAAQRARVFPVSPSTLWPVLNTLAGVLRQIEFSQNAAAMQAIAAGLAGQAAGLADQAHRVERDWAKLRTDLRGLTATADEVAASAEAFSGVKPSAQR